jgi:hypothetical protein
MKTLANSRAFFVVAAALTYACLMWIGLRYFFEGLGMQFISHGRYSNREVLFTYLGPMSILPAALLSLWSKVGGIAWLLIGAVASFVVLLMLPYAKSELAALVESIHLPMVLSALAVFGLMRWSARWKAKHSS